MYFMRNTNEEAKQWNCHVDEDLPMDIVTELQEKLHHSHVYVSIFKYTFNNIYMPDHNETIRTNMKPGRNLKPFGEKKLHYHELCQWLETLENL